MIKTLIIEDEPYIRKGLIALIENFENDLLIIGECGSVKEGITVAKACKPDLILLDVNLTDGNAFDFLEQTYSLNYKVIFITAYKEYAIQALKQGAIDYILKPVDMEELEIAINKVKLLNISNQQEQINNVKHKLVEDHSRLYLNFHDSIQIINFKELMYCVSDKGYTTFHLKDGKSHIASKPLKYFENKIPDSMFFRTHQSYFVNLSCIQKYDKNGYVILNSGTKIPVSIRKKEDFLMRLTNNNY